MVQQYGEKLIDFEWNSFPFDYDEFKASVYCERLRYYFGMIQPGMVYASIMHGIGHAERVAFYCAILAWLRGLEEDITNILIVAGLLHDVGRSNDFHDPLHGMKSVEKLQTERYNSFLSTLSDRTMLLYLVQNHCEAKPDVSVEFKYLCVLKDSDALDRVRLGYSYIWLFTNEARQLKEFSEEVYSRYKEEKADTIYYHITTVENISSIKSTGLKCPPGRGVYFGATADDCLQLVPCATGFYFLKRFVERIPNRYSKTAVTYDAALLAVDLHGLTDKLRAHPTWKVRDMTEGKGVSYTDEYILYEDVSPDRITYEGIVTLRMDAPEFLYDTIKAMIDRLL